jgi:hypothetical protein
VPDLSENLTAVLFGVYSIWEDKIHEQHVSLVRRNSIFRSETLLTVNNTTMSKCHWLAALENTW